MRYLKQTLTLALAVLLALGLAHAPGALAAEPLEDYDAASSVRWSFPTVDGATIDQDTYAGQTLLLIFYRANGACGNSNGTVRALAQADWAQTDGLKIVAVGCGETGEDEETVAEHVQTFREEYAPGCDAVDFCCATSDQMWKTVRALETLVGGRTNSITYAINYLFDASGHLRFTWQGGYNTARYTAALTALGLLDESPAPSPTPEPSPEPSPEPAPAGDGLYTVSLPGTEDYDAAYAIFDQLNAYRQESGLSPLVMDQGLLATGMRRAAEIALYYSHTRPDGSSCFTAFPASASGGTRRENIAAGYLDPESVMTGWENSPGHNENMLARDNRSVGIGAFTDSAGTHYWVQVFSSARGTEAARATGARAVTATLSAPAEALELSAAPASLSLKVGETATLTLRNANVTWTSDKAALRAAAATSDDPSVAAVSLAADGTAVVTARAVGRASLRLGLAAPSGGSPLTVEVPVTVSQTVPASSGNSGSSGASGGQSFADVPRGSWYAEGVTYVVEAGLFQGVGENAFAPNADMTRAMLMTVLARLDGQSTEGGAAWYSRGMAWAKAQGISDGTDPNGSVTREQLVTMLYRYAASPASAGSLSAFSDRSQVSSWARDAVTWAVAQGVLTGKDGSRLDPQGTATRAEVATLLLRFAARNG